MHMRTAEECVMQVRLSSGPRPPGNARRHHQHVVPRRGRVSSLTRKQQRVILIAGAVSLVFAIVILLHGRSTRRPAGSRPSAPGTFESDDYVESGPVPGGYPEAPRSQGGGAGWPSPAPTAAAPVSGTAGYVTHPYASASGPSSGAYPDQALQGSPSTSRARRPALPVATGEEHRYGDEEDAADVAAYQRQRRLQRTQPLYPQ